MDALIQTLFSKRQELLIAIWQHIQIFPSLQFKCNTLTTRP
ncbi:hypothetical protein [Lacticaseibacillus paracasei]|nr:hypothetical protein [Lacticaseibacillus paracasei]